eukprot:TRINITY_DN1234_c0_g1_i1.p1 TRINITY_DN1234_c0_g1~~TRINITY_DN1234_c0_g1_i1.p1  ORF type:complete len:275 (-),score=49.43 TRINITY_DN1234_c0_g1_i1:199-1023(-)
MKLLSFAIFTLCALAGARAQSIKSCGTDADVLKNAVFSIAPDPIQKGSPLTITATGELQSPVGSGSFHVDLAIKALGIVNKAVNITTPFTISPGAVVGPQKITIGPFTLPKVPGSTSISGIVTGIDGASNGQIFCIALNLDVATPPLEVLPMTNEKLGAPPVVGNCGSAADHLKDITTSAVGGVTTLTGTLDETVSAGEVNIDLKIKVSFFNIPINMNVPFTFSPGFTAGPIKASVGPNSPATSLLAPNVDVSVTGTVKVNDAAPSEIACLSLS